MAVGLASLKGFEPPAYRLGGGRSIQLSYRDLYAALGNMYSIPDFLPNCKQMPFSPGRFLTFLLALYLKKHYYNTYSISWT